MTRFKSNRQIADDVKERFAGDLYQIRKDGSRTDRWRKIEIAKVEQQMRRERRRLTSERDAAKKQHRMRLENELFGSGTPNDPSAVISRRDAGDRAAQLKTEAEATQLLARANRTGDEPLARAVVERAFEMRWVDVTNTFLESRPHLDTGMNELWGEHIPNLSEELIEGMALFSKPEELGAMSDYEIDRLAEADPNAVETWAIG